jgi:hypothetical protein
MEGGCTLVGIDPERAPGVAEKVVTRTRPRAELFRAVAKRQPKATI